MVSYGDTGSSYAFEERTQHQMLIGLIGNNAEPIPRRSHYRPGPDSKLKSVILDSSV